MSTHTVRNSHDERIAVPRQNFQMIEEVRQVIIDKNSANATELSRMHLSDNGVVYLLCAFP